MGLQARTLDVVKKRKATVIWYDRFKGHGYLIVDGCPSDLYMHASEVRKAGIAAEALLPKSSVLCNVGEFKGRPCAVDLELDAQTAS